MHILLDSHALLWALHDPMRLTLEARAAIADTRYMVYFSAASVWELELKAAKGKLTLPPNWLDAAQATGFVELPLTASDAQASARLPWHHSDPFDRALIAQAVERGLRLATRDPLMNAYEVDTLVV
jgi:PIN domain nuclease of toxin-antitoxin system